ncbi:MAG: efflux RND transporter periplasmic adaptor subunit [Candidatus Omnitrophica bacterium]|nr:efflux RND transporter periplasmic adaptor subunit [Candidatus Omnitrophota bacterium]MDD5027418.1 efflux RND transporter periplasmic adaptor subunit [Candidatus Omnitrophota bacterium]MDD5662579.1 efflux RND transporter periplasmic adaptor subunit [Candidatus Omnitrophota bacterium]
MQSKLKPVVLCLGIPLILLTAVGCVKKSKPLPQTPEVSVVFVRPERVVITTELPGRTAAFLIAEIRPQVNGLIQKRLFTEGSEVKAGQVLYQIDPAPYQAAYDKARANLPALKLRVDRYKEALVEKAVSQQEFDDADAALKQAQAELETAQINLNYTQVTSPITGRIGTSSISDGDIVTAYQPTALATVQQLDPIYVDIPQSTTELLRLRRSLEDGRLNSDNTNQNKVKLILDDGSAYPLEGELQFQDVTVDPTTGSVILRVIFPNPRGVLLPGMFVRTVIIEGVNEQAILVPQQGVSRNPQGEATTLIVDADNKVQQRMLTLERAIGDKWLISSGLSLGDRVIVEGIQRVRPGTSVKVVSFNSATN